MLALRKPSEQSYSPEEKKKFIQVYIYIYDLAISEQATHSLVLSGVQPCSFTPGFVRPGKAEKDLVGDHNLPSSL